MQREDAGRKEEDARGGGHHARGVREEQFAARGVRDAGRKTRAAAGITGGGVVRPVDALCPPLRISRDKSRAKRTFRYIQNYTKTKKRPKPSLLGPLASGSSKGSAHRLGQHSPWVLA